MDWQRDPTTRFPHLARYEASTVEVRRLCCLEEVAARCKYQQRVDWQRVPTTEGSRYEASAGAKEETVFCVSSDGFLKSLIEDLLRRTDYNIMGLLVESKPKPSPT